MAGRGRVRSSSTLSGPDPDAGGGSRASRQSALRGGSLREAWAVIHGARHLPGEALGRRPAFNPQPAPTALAFGADAAGQKSGGKAGRACSRSGGAFNLFGFLCQDRWSGRCFGRPRLIAFASKQPGDRDVLVDFAPMQACTAQEDGCALLGRGMEQAREPRERHAQRAAIIKIDPEGVSIKPDGEGFRRKSHARHFRYRRAVLL